MENLSNKVLELKNGKNYFIIRQALYRGKTYYFAVEVTEDEDDYTNNFLFFERVDVDGKFSVLEVTDPKLLEVLARNIHLEE